MAVGWGRSTWGDGPWGEPAVTLVPDRDWETQL